MKLLGLFAPILLIAYYFGLPLKPIGLGLVVLCIVILRKGSPQNGKIQLPIFLTALLILFYPILVFLLQAARLKMGGQGIDFAIFSQAVYRLSTFSILDTSFLDWQWQHFLTHHFSPYLFIVGWFDRFIFHSAEYSLLLFHSCAVFGILLFVFLIGLTLDKDIRTALLFTAFCILLPSPRVALLWEVRDEIFALPFLLAAYYFWLRQRNGKAIFSLCICLLFKETLFLAVASFSLMALLSFFFQRKIERKNVLIYTVLGGLSLVGFFLYTKVFPGWLFWPTFNATERWSDLHEFFNRSALEGKLTWFAVLFIPLLPLIVCDLFSVLSKARKKIPEHLAFYAIRLLPAFPFLGIILISNFQESYNPYAYYAVVPAFLIAIGVYSSLQYIPVERKYPLLLFSCLLALLFGPTVPIGSEIQKAYAQESPISSLRPIIPQTAVVIADGFDASFFIRQKKVTRLYHANKNILKFDYIVQRKTGQSPSAQLRLSAYLRAWSKLCYEDDTWRVRCAFSRVRPQESSPSLGNREKT